jgi:uncharacterized protein YjiS (DUF1127 family)
MPDPNATVATAWDAMKAWLDKNDSVLYLPDAFFQKQFN